MLAQLTGYATLLAALLADAVVSRPSPNTDKSIFLGQWHPEVTARHRGD